MYKSALRFLLLCSKLCFVKGSQSEESYVIESVQPTNKEGKIAPNSIPHIRILDNPTTLTHQMNTGKYCTSLCSKMR